MDLVLRQRLPLEIVELIMRKVHELNFKPCLDNIKHNLLWIRHEGEYPVYFLFNQETNYYEFLIQWVNAEPIAVYTSRQWKEAT